MTRDKYQVSLPDHQTDCTGENLETFDTPGPRGTFRVTRCCGCGAQQTTAPDEDPLVYGSDEWLEAWHNDKMRIGRHLTEAEKFDPEKNPLHPHAESWPERTVRKH